MMPIEMRAAAMDHFGSPRVVHTETLPVPKLGKKDIVVKGGTVAWPDGVEPAPNIPRGVHRKSYDGEPSTRAFARLNELVAREPFHVELSKVYPLDATSQALRDVQHHHVGKLAIKIDGA